MRYGLFTSVILHVAILGWALFTIQSQPELRVAEPEPIVTGLVTEGELTKLRQGERTAKQLEAEPRNAHGRAGQEGSGEAQAGRCRRSPAAARRAAARRPRNRPRRSPSRPAGRAATAAGTPASAACRRRRRAKEARGHAEGAAASGRRADEGRGAEGRPRSRSGSRRSTSARRPRPRRSATRSGRKKLPSSRRSRTRRRSARRPRPRRSIRRRKDRGLLNKMPDKGAPRPSVPLDEQAKSLNKGPVLGAPGRARSAALGQRDCHHLAQIIKSCVQTKWNVLGGGESAQHTQVKVRLRFNPDGTPRSRAAGRQPAKFALLPGGAGERAARRARVRALPSAARQVRHLEGYRAELRSPRHVLAVMPYYRPQPNLPENRNANANFNACRTARSFGRSHGRRPARSPLRGGDRGGGSDGGLASSFRPSSARRAEKSRAPPAPEPLQGEFRGCPLGNLGAAARCSRRFPRRRSSRNARAQRSKADPSRSTSPRAR